jgi:hypothetical protein
METKENLSTEQQERNEGLVAASSNTSAFAEYSEQRDKWLATPIAFNTTLARGGYPFTIIDATIREFEATEMDVSRGFKIGDPVEKIAYLCRSQMDWVHYPIGDSDVKFVKGEMFVILMNANPIRVRDLERIKTLLKDGPIYNIAMQEYPNKTKGFQPAHGLVTAQQWRSI